MFLETNKFQGHLKNVSMKFFFVLQFCSRMYLIAASRAEGGLVFTYLGWGETKSRYLGS